MANEPGKYRQGVDHAGRSRAMARKGDVAIDVHHGPMLARGQEAQQHTTATLGKPPKAKGYNVGIHNGMHTVNRASGQRVLGGNLASYDSNPANPLNAGPPVAKRLTPVQPVPGQRRRVNDAVGGSAPGDNHAKGQPDVGAMRDLGAAILSEAMAHSAPDDRQAHGYGIASLPDSVKE